jgi:predicted enzyme related to lactoylglutathione lyase
MPMLSSSQPINFVATSNPKRAGQFYEKILGLKFVSGDQFALVFDINGTMLRIQIVDKVSPHAYTSLGWKVADIQREVNELSKRGVTFERYDGLNQDQSGIWTSPSGGKIAWFTDPDKNILSLTQF